MTKLAGEQMALAYASQALVVRSAGLYGRATPIENSSGGIERTANDGRPKSFVETMLRLARSERPIRVVDDQRLTPTLTSDLAPAIVDALEHGITGVLHITNTGSCSWCEFAQAIFEISGISPELSAISTAAYGAPAPRPSYSILSMQRLVALGLEPPRPWRDALRAYLVGRR